MPAILYTLLTFHEDIFWLNGQFSNIALISTTLLTFHEDKFWLKEVHWLNILPISITLLTFHEDRFELNEVHPLNIIVILVTLLTFHEDRFELNEVHPANILVILITLLTFHEDRFELNEVHPSNALSRFVSLCIRGDEFITIFNPVNWNPLLDRGIFPNWTISNADVYSMKKLDWTLKDTPSFGEELDKIVHSTVTTVYSPLVVIEGVNWKDPSSLMMGRWSRIGRFDSFGINLNIKDGIWPHEGCCTPDAFDHIGAGFIITTHPLKSKISVEQLVNEFAIEVTLATFHATIFNEDIGELKKILSKDVFGKMTGVVFPNLIFNSRNCDPCRERGMFPNWMISNPVTILL
jgi:hypothetical protein